VPGEASQESADSLSEDGFYENRSNDESWKQLNRFLQGRDSPVCHVLSVPWNEAKDRTKRQYLRKAEQCVSAVLTVLAPEDSKCLWEELCEGRGNLRMTGGKSRKDLELLDAFAESYSNAQHWSTRRQILSILADKLSFKELKEFLPTVTSYCYNIARQHALLHGRGEPIPSHENRRMKVDQGKLEDFILLITSPPVVQDVPFRERMLKLSTGEVIQTLNVIRLMIPERIIQQYQQYCSKRDFKPMSKRTLQRVLNDCSASVRKSLQGLDNFSAQGAEAFDELDKLVDKLVDCGKTQVWAREIKQHLHS